MLKTTNTLMSFSEPLLVQQEKDSADKCNIACILTLPPFQRKGYGQFLIAFAYELSKREGMIGTPERPLSDLGQKGFTSYWTRVLLETIRDHLHASIEDLTKWTSIRSEDVVSTLKPLGLVMYWKHEYIAHFNKRTVEKHLENLKSQPLWLKFDTDKLNWPFVPPNVPRTPKKPRARRR